MTIFNFQFSIFNSKRGFTLIELMIALSITAVLGTIGIAGFRNYSQIQVFQSSVSDFATALNTARSRSLSQVKPDNLCTSGNTLDGYGIKILADSAVPKYSYTMFLKCSGSDKSVDKEKLLPKNIIFDSLDNGKLFFFPTVIGGTQTPGQVTISGYGRGKTIVVGSLGGISMVTPTPTPTLAPTPTPTPNPNFFVAVNFELDQKLSVDCNISGSFELPDTSSGLGTGFSPTNPAGYTISVSFPDYLLDKYKDGSGFTVSVHTLDDSCKVKIPDSISFTKEEAKKATDGGTEPYKIIFHVIPK